MQEILEQPGQRIRFRAPLGAFQIQQPYNLSRVSHVPTREQTAPLQTLSRLTRTNVDIEPLKTVLIFCGTGLLASLLAIETYGLDLSVGFF